MSHAPRDGEARGVDSQALYRCGVTIANSYRSCVRNTRNGMRALANHTDSELEAACGLAESACPCGRRSSRMRPVKGRVDLGAAKDACVALQVGAGTLAPRPTLAASFRFDESWQAPIAAEQPDGDREHRCRENAQPPEDDRQEQSIGIDFQSTHVGVIPEHQHGTTSSVPDRSRRPSRCRAGSERAVQRKRLTR